jgi:hypothetical protein
MFVFDCAADAFQGCTSSLKVDYCHYEALVCL